MVNMKIIKLSEIRDFLNLIKEHAEEIRRLSLTTTYNEETMRTIYRHIRDLLNVIDDFEEKHGIYGKW
jgi:hypothetical protein